MSIVIEESSNAALIHDIMIKAFSEYNSLPAPSSALDETVEMISTSLLKGEKALIGFVESEAIAMVRFQLKENHLYFSRLSVVPEFQGKGVAKLLLKGLEDYARSKGIPEIQCKVRVNVPRNIHLYHSLDYEIFEQEVVRKENGIKLQVVSMKKRVD